MSLPTDSKARKGMPVVRGNLRYFPDAHLAVAELSMYGNDKHNPGEELHWSRGKSSDHADCCARHLLEPFGIDYSYGPEKGVLHSVAAAWRALANAQTEIEELKAKGMWPLPALPDQSVRQERGIPWSGGVQPVPDGVLVRYLLREDDEWSGPDPAEELIWHHSGMPNDVSDIVRYEVVR